VTRGKSWLWKPGEYRFQVQIGEREFKRLLELLDVERIKYPAPHPNGRMSVPGKETAQLVRRVLRDRWERRVGSLKSETPQQIVAASEADLHIVRLLCELQLTLGRIGWNLQARELGLRIVSHVNHAASLLEAGIGRDLVLRENAELIAAVVNMQRLVYCLGTVIDVDVENEALRGASE